MLDEPTIGLHMANVERLIRVLHWLVDAGTTVAESRLLLVGRTIMLS